MDNNTHMQGFGKQVPPADNNRNTIVGQTDGNTVSKFGWTVDNQGRVLMPGTSETDGGAFSPVSGAAEQNFSDPRVTWTASDMGRGTNGVPQVHGDDIIGGTDTDARRNDSWGPGGEDPAVKYVNGGSEFTPYGSIPQGQASNNG